jgi:16S rRNA (guanine527-N7)-methyltransferase
VPEFGWEDFQAATGVSRETLSRLKAYADLLVEWNSRHNLVARSTLADMWRRHFWDSAQLVPLVPPVARTLADLGSGAGFPGLVLAVLLEGRVSVTLHEATAKKCDFLRAAAEHMNIAVTIRSTRMEDLPPEPFDIVTARACAPLDKLLSYAQNFAGPHSLCLFLKGQNVGAELTEAHKSWKMKLRQIPSLTDPSGIILELGELSRHVRTPPVRIKSGEKAPHSGGRQPKGRRR